MHATHNLECPQFLAWQAITATSPQLRQPLGAERRNWSASYIRRNFNTQLRRAMRCDAQQDKRCNAKSNRYTRCITVCNTCTNYAYACERWFKIISFQSEYKLHAVQKESKRMHACVRAPCAYICRQRSFFKHSITIHLQVTNLDHRSNFHTRRGRARSSLLTRQRATDHRTILNDDNHSKTNGSCATLGRDNIAYIRRIARPGSNNIVCCDAYWTRA